MTSDQDMDKLERELKQALGRADAELAEAEREMRAAKARVVEAWAAWAAVAKKAVAVEAETPESNG